MEQIYARDMASVAIITLILRVGAPISNSVGKTTSSQPHQGRSSLLLAAPGKKRLRDTWTHTGGISLFPRDSAMPRIRGKPRRGAAWYAAESRRRRKKEFERAMAIVARRRRTRSRLHSKEREEEVNPQANPPGHSRHNMALNTQNPSSTLGTRQPAVDEPDPSTSQVAKEAPPEPYSPCYIVEEAPPEPTTDNTEAEPERPQHRATEADAAGSEDSRERHRGEQPSAEDWGYLNLLHDIRSQLDDQTFRLERMDHRLDMFFAAHSRASTKQQCPTCARPYSFPARWKHSEI
jgi:hypothetical protein